MPEILKNCVQNVNLKIARCLIISGVRGKSMKTAEGLQQWALSDLGLVECSKSTFWGSSRHSF